jgi:DNA repair exonuclease SbcCD ATPase subunit
MQTEIAELLNNIHEENQRNAENFEKVLAGINTKLEAIEEDNEAVELVRFYISELKKAMEDRFSAALIRHDAIEASFDGLISAQSQLAKTSELKDLFGVFSAHNDALMGEISGQKDLLNVLDSRISQIDTKTISQEELNSIIHEVTSDLSALGESVKADFTQLEDSLKELEISEQITKVENSVDELKNIVNSAPDYSKDFENLEKNLETVVTEVDFAKFRENLADFVQKIIDNSSTLNSELTLSTERIIDIVNSIDFSELKDDLDILKNCLEDLKGISYKASFDDLSILLSHIANDINSLRATIGADVQENYGAVKSNIETLITNLQIVKDDLANIIIEQKFDPTEVIEAINGLSQDFRLAIGDIRENSNNNYDALKNYLEEISSNIGSLQDSASVLKTDNVIDREKLNDIAQNISKLEPIDYSYNIEQVSGKLDDLSNTIESIDIEEKFVDIKNLIDSLDNSEAIKNQFEDFEKAFAKIVTAEDFLNFKTEFAEFIQKIIDNSNALYDNSNTVKDITSDGFENLQHAMNDLSVNIQYLRDISSHKPAEVLDNINLYINNAVESLSSNSKTNLETLKNKFEEISSQISDIKNEFIQKSDATDFNISSCFDNIKISLENLLTAFNSIGETNDGISAIDEKITKLNELIAELSTAISLKQEELAHHIDEVGETRFAQLKTVTENIDGLKTYIGDGIENLKNYISDFETSANATKIEADEKVTQKLLDLESSFIQSSHEYEHKLELLQGKITEFAHIVENSNSDTEGKIASSLEEIEIIKSELATLNDGLKSAKVSVDEKFGETVSIIDAGIENIVFNITNLTDNIVSGVSSSFKEDISIVDEKFEKLFETLDEVKNQHTSNNTDLIQDIENKISALKDELSLVNSDIANAVECKSEEIIRAFEPVKTGIEEFIGFDFEKILADLKSQIELTFMNFSVDINSEFVSNSQAISKLEQAFKETFNKLSDIEECVTEKIQNDIELLNITLENSSKDVRTNLETKFKENIDELKNYFDVAINNIKIDDPINDLKSDLENQISQIGTRLDIMVTDTSTEELNERLDEISENDTNISKSVQEVSDKLDDFSQTGNHVSEMISALHTKLDVLATDNSDFDILEELDGIKDIIFEQRKFFEVSSDEKATAIDNYLKDVLLKLDSVDLEKNAEDIKDAILNALVSLVDQISFVEETEEIKDFVEEKTEEINQHLVEVSNQLKQLATIEGDDFDYTYTLQDVESDIAKLRLAVTNMSGNDFSEITDEIKKIVDAVDELENSLTQEQIIDLKDGIEKLSEDIVSISSRTNKLLLTSDESYKALNDGLNNFGNLIYKLEDRINYLDNTETSERIERKIDGIHTLAVEADNANKVSHQVMTYLGEWIDSAGENINVISEKTEEITDIKESIQELREIIPEKDVLLDNLEHKFEAQEERIDRLEKTLDKILTHLEEKDDTILEKKIDNLEKLISKFGTDIEKLTTYVDEE